MASLCATSNETQLLNDPTGNRRNIIFEVTGQFDYEKYNAIDKEQLFAQIKWMFDKGYKSALMPRMIEEINLYTGQHNSEICIEAELVNMFYEEPGIHGQYDFRTATQIKNHIESNSVQKISIKKLGMELKRLGYERVKVEGVYGYYIGEVTR
jgi:predicted P-loop ATPase